MPSSSQHFWRTSVCGELWGCTFLHAPHPSARIPLELQKQGTASSLPCMAGFQSLLDASTAMYFSALAVGGLGFGYHDFLPGTHVIPVPGRSRRQPWIHFGAACCIQSSQAAVLAQLHWCATRGCRDYRCDATRRSPCRESGMSTPGSLFLQRTGPDRLFVHHPSPSPIRHTRRKIAGGLLSSSCREIWHEQMGHAPLRARVQGVVRIPDSCTGGRIDRELMHRLGFAIPVAGQAAPGIHPCCDQAQTPEPGVMPAPGLSFSVWTNVR